MFTSHGHQIYGSTALPRPSGMTIEPCGGQNWCQVCALEQVQFNTRVLDNGGSLYNNQGANKMGQIPVQGALKDMLGTVAVADVNRQLSQHVGGRSLQLLQWAAWNATSNPNFAVDGNWNQATVDAFIAARNQGYSLAKYAPTSGAQVNLAFLTDFLHDYGDFPSPVTVIQGV